MKDKLLLTLLLLLCSVSNSFGQSKIYNIKTFSNFFDSVSTENSLLIVGQNHSSSAGPTIYPKLVKYLNKKNDLRSLLIEFGPSEAYFYNLYLKTGNERWLNYTIFAGYYKDWKTAWKKIYQYNKTLKNHLKVIGIDFDRTRTFGYALYKMFSNYKNLPNFVDSLMAVIRDTSFYNTYTIGYPKQKGLKFVSRTKQLFKKHLYGLKKILNEEDFSFIENLLENKAVDYNDEREKALASNIERIIHRSNDSKFLLLIGRDHAYRNAIYSNKTRLARFLSTYKSLNILTGVTLFANSKLWSGGYKKTITLNEIKKKIPWLDFYSDIKNKMKGNFTVILLNGELKPLSYYTDYIIVAEEQKAISF